MSHSRRQTRAGSALWILTAVCLLALHSQWGLVRTALGGDLDVYYTAYSHSHAYAKMVLQGTVYPAEHDVDDLPPPKQMANAVALAYAKVVGLPPEPRVEVETTANAYMQDNWGVQQLHALVQIRHERHNYDAAEELSGHGSGSVKVSGTLSGLADQPLGSKLVVTFTADNVLPSNDWWYMAFADHPLPGHEYWDYQNYHHVDPLGLNLRIAANTMPWITPDDDIHFTYRQSLSYAIEDVDHDTWGAQYTGVHIDMAIVDDELHWRSPDWEEGSFEDPSNWREEMAPCWGDDVVFDDAGPCTVWFESAQELATLAVSEGDLTFDLMENELSTWQHMRVDSQGSLTISAGDAYSGGPLTVSGRLDVGSDLGWTSLFVDDTLLVTGEFNVFGELGTQGDVDVRGDVLVRGGTWGDNSSEFVIGPTGRVEINEAGFFAEDVSVRGDLILTDVMDLYIGRLDVQAGGTADLDSRITCMEAKVGGTLKLHGDFAYAEFDSLEVSSSGKAEIGGYLTCWADVTVAGTLDVIGEFGYIEAMARLSVAEGAAVTLKDDAFAHIEGDVAVAGGLELLGEMTSLEVAGNLDVEGNGQLSCAGTLGSYSDLTVAGKLGVPSAGLFTSHGDMHVKPSGTAAVLGFMGVGILADNLEGPGITVAASGSLRNDGTITSDLHVLLGGTCSGTGQVVGNVTNEGEVSPGSSPGTLTVDGDFVQTDDGVLTVEIGASGEGLYDRMIVAGELSLGGTLIFRLLDGYGPNSLFGGVYDVLTYRGSRSGEFDDFGGTISQAYIAGIDYDFDLGGGNSAVRITLHDVLGGDTDLDGDVDAWDIQSILEAKSYENGSGWLREHGDFNGDTIVDWTDIQMILDHGQYDVQLQAQLMMMVPEPATLGLLVLGAVALIRRRRRR